MKTTRATGGLLALASLTLPLALATPASAATVTPTSDALVLAQATTANDSVITGASFLALPPTGMPHGVVQGALAGTPTEGDDTLLLTTGSAAAAPNADQNAFSGEFLGGAEFRGDTDRDVSVLKIDLNVPAGVNCLTGIDFKFLSEEFPEFVGSEFNDAFIAELDESTWTTSGSTISAPGNFAFDPTGNPITINAAGTTSMKSEEAAGTVYDAATPLLTASTPITSGAHSLFLSIFDQGDEDLDSAVLVDNLRFGTVAEPATDCKPGAEVVEPEVETLYTARSGSLYSFTRDDTALQLVGPTAGLRSGDRIVGLDQRPATGDLYALGTQSGSSQLYTVDTATGALTAVGGPFNPGFGTAGVGFDFNPQVDRIRVISTSGDNLRLNPDTGAVAAVDKRINFAPGDPSASSVPFTTAAAYTNPDNDPSTPTQLFDIQHKRAALMLQAPPNDGVVSTVGALGFTGTNRNGFDIAKDGTPLLAMKPGTAVSGLYSLDLASGAPTRLGDLTLNGVPVEVESLASITR